MYLIGSDVSHFFKYKCSVQIYVIANVIFADYVSSKANIAYDNCNLSLTNFQLRYWFDLKSYILYIIIVQS